MIRWEEEWGVAGDRSHRVETPVRGSGARMEAPAGSPFEGGVWRYAPHVPPLDVLRLTIRPIPAATSPATSEAPGRSPSRRCALPRRRDRLSACPA